MFECVLCNGQYRHKRDLNRHIRAVHGERDGCICEICGQAFQYRCNLLRHTKTIHQKESFLCQYCDSRFSRSDNLKQHIKYQHMPKAQVETECVQCGVNCLSPAELKAHVQAKHGMKMDTTNLWKTAFGGYLSHYRLEPDVGVVDDYENSFKDLKPKTLDTLFKHLQDGPVKFILQFRCGFYKLFKEIITESYPTFTSKPQRVLNKDDAREAVKETIQDIITKVTEYESLGSGWIFGQSLYIDLHVGKYQPLPSARYIPLSKSLQAKKAIINIQNDDEYCFLWCVLADLYPVEQNPQRVNHYTRYVNWDDNVPKVDGLNLDGIRFPTTITDIERFECQNDYAINIFTADDDVIIPYRIAQKTGKRILNLFYMSIAEGDDKVCHFALIKSFSRLMNAKNSHSLFYCYHCLHGFIRRDLLENHQDYCRTHKDQRIEMPQDEEDDILSFQNHHKQLMLPYIFVADFECSIIKGTSGDKHKANSFVLYKIGLGKTFSPYTYIGDDASEKFVQKLDEEIHWIHDRQQKYRHDVKPMTTDQLEDFENAETCHICGKLLEGDKVLDHDHNTGCYRGAAHSQCNLSFRLQEIIPVFLHNFSKYDLKLIVKGLKNTPHHIRAIPDSMESYLSMTVGKARFLDSYRFLPSSLETLVKNLKDKGLDKFVHTQRWLDKNAWSEHLELLVGKAPYPYEWVDTLEKLNEKTLPPKEDFYSKLSGKGISEEDYQHACNVFRVLKMKSFKDYHLLYLTLDGLLLADVISDLRTTTQADCNLDPAHYLSIPNLSFDIMLKSTEVELELLTDPDMYLIFENNIRGGVSSISHRYAKANNPLVPGYDKTKPTSWLMYVDAVNLYGWSMVQKMPYGEFRWLEEHEISSFDVMSIPDDGDDCYFLEVDLDYPPSLHDSHSDYPLAPEALRPTDEMLSPYTKRLKENLSVGTSNRKLIPNLMPKNKYLAHFRNLKFYLRQGLILKKIHRIVACKQSFWLKPYVEENTAKRKAATSEFDKTFYKLKVNSCYGKLLQNPRKHLRVELTNKKERVRKLIADPTYISHKIFFGDDDEMSLAAFHRSTVTLKLNKPIYAGFTVLELSKLLMMEHYYDHLKPKYDDKIKLCFTDTDSFLYHVETENIYADMAEDIDMYDTSAYPRDHQLYSDKNKKVLGKFSDETNGLPIEAFVGLKSKVYAIKLSSEDEKKRLKGIKRHLTKKMTFNLYLETLQKGDITTETFSMITSTNMQLETKTVSKVALTAYDDKRYIHEDGISTLAYGHYRIPTMVATSKRSMDHEDNQPASKRNKLC